jgi:uncharacterized phiE125 gp8 family phage protein
MSDNGEFGNYGYYGNRYGNQYRGQFEQRLRISLVTPASGDPVSLSEAKLHCRIDENADNAIVQSLIRAATVVCETHIRRPIMTQEFKQFFDRWPTGSSIELSRGPLLSVTSVKTYTDADVATTFASTNYFVDTSTIPGRIVLRQGVTWPTFTRYANPIEIQYKAGYGDDPNGVPPEIRQAVLATVSYLYENRGEAVAPMPEIATLLLSTHRDWRF